MNCFDNYVGGVDLIFWINKTRILSCWDKSTTCCNEHAMSLGVFWWWMKRICCAREGTYNMSNE